MRRCFAELVGTFILVFMGTGAVITNDISEGKVTHVGISLVFGLVVLALASTLGDLSGAHINPAVTLGFCVARRFSWRQFVPYVASQSAGAILASLLLHSMFPAHESLGATVLRGDNWQSLVLETILTWFLMLAVLGVSTGAKEKGWLASVVVGSVVALEALFAGPISGASMNPARSLGPALVSGEMASYWIYVVGPCAGAVLAVVTYACLERREES